MASIRDWWRLGVLLEDTLDGCKKDEIVYVMDNIADHRVFMFVERSYTGMDVLASDMSLMDKALKQGEEGDFVVVIPKNRKITILPKNSARIMEVDEWKERLLSLIDNSEISEKGRGWETLSSLFTVIHQAQSTYIESILNQVSHDVIDLLKQFQAVPSERFSQTTDILKTIFETTYELMFMRILAAFEFERDKNEKKAFSENVVQQLQALFLQFKAELDENERLYIDSDVFRWKETDEALEDHLVRLMETGNLYLHFFLVPILHNDEHKIGVLMKCILNQKNYPALKHTGVCWYVLLYCLQHIAATVKVFNKKKQRFRLSGDDDENLEDDLKVFHEAIHKTEELQQLFNNVEFKKQLRNLLMQTGKLTSSNVYHHLNQLFGLSWPQFHSRVMTEKTILNEAELESVEKIRSLGMGVSAEVYLSRIPDIPSEIVAKIFEPKFYKDLGNELRLQMRLQSHPQVAHIYGYIVQRGEYVGILMEHCKGGSMQDALNEQDTVIDEARALNWLRQAASGLMFLRENNCIHRDVKPGNLLLNKRRTKLKISDLGVTKEERVNRPCPKERILQRTRKAFSITGVGAALASEPGITDGLCGDCGTPGYQAPEIEEGEEKATPAVDVFSLGRTIWQLVYSRPPTDKLVDDTWGANQGTTTDIYQHKFQPSDELKNLALRMMSPLKEDRPKMREVYQQLTEMQAEDKNRVTKIASTSPVVLGRPSTRSEDVIREIVRRLKRSPTTKRREGRFGGFDSNGYTPMAIVHDGLLS